MFNFCSILIFFFFIDLKFELKKCTFKKMDEDSILRLIDIADEMDLSKYSWEYIDEISNPNSSVYSEKDSLENQIRQRDIVIDSLRQTAKLNMSLPDSSKEAVEAIKSEYERIIKDQTEKFLKEKRETEEIYMTEIKRLRSLIEEHRENLYFKNLPKLCPKEYDKINSSPQSNVTLVQFIASQLYEYDRDQKMKYQNIIEEHTKLEEENKQLKQIILNQEQKLCSESNIRASLEKNLENLTNWSPKYPEENADLEYIKKKYEESQKELHNMKLAYQSAIARNDVLVETIKKANTKMQEDNDIISERQKDSSSLQSQLDMLNEELRQQQELLDKRDEEIRDLKQRHHELLVKTLQSF